MKKIFVGIICILLLESCSTIFEKPITNATLLIYTPTDSSVTKIYRQQFYWEPVSGATSYRLQIAKPSFSSGMIQSIEIDTILSTNKITITLNPGQYEWRLRAQNGGSETPYTTRSLFIKETTFNERTFTVTKPLSGKTTVTYGSGVEFVWSKLTGTENYYIEIDTLSGGFTDPTVTKVSGSLTDIDVTLKKRGSYNWRMYADSAGIKSQYTSSGKIIFKMDTVRQLTPANNAPSLNQIVDLIWQEPSHGISTDIYSYTVNVYKSDNSLFNTYSDIPNKSVKVIGLSKGESYYWTVIAKDQYELESIPTMKYKFTVAP